jgi:hypothetical protein
VKLVPRLAYGDERGTMEVSRSLPPNARHDNSFHLFRLMMSQIRRLVNDLCTRRGAVGFARPVGVGMGRRQPADDTAPPATATAAPEPRFSATALTIQFAGYRDDIAFATLVLDSSTSAAAVTVTGTFLGAVG